MWNLTGAPPTLIDARVLTTLPDALRRPGRSDWADANQGGEPVDSFLEGPSFDREGHLWLTDIPHGRIFRVSPDLQWTEIVAYDGWPNGLAIHRDGQIWITDYRRGLLRLDPASGRISDLLGHRNSESFRGLNDLTFDDRGRCWFTDQGQTGLHDPSGRVYRWDPDSGNLDCLLDTAPSPNGIAVDPDGRTLFVAVTRANAVWRGPVMRDGSLAKLGAFRTFYGTSGPDGLALDAAGRLIVAHASLGAAFVVDTDGAIRHIVRSPVGGSITNVAFRPGTTELVLTESRSASVLVATLDTGGATLFSHG